MSEPIDTQNDTQPTDFAEVALKSMTVDTEAQQRQEPTPAKAPEPKAPDAPKQRVPESLLPKKDEAKAASEPESELSKFDKPDFKDPKRAAQWSELHSKASEFEKQARAEAKARAEAETKIAAMEARIAEAEKAGKNTDALEKKLAEYESIVKTVSVENDPEFRARYIEGRAAKVKEIQAIIADAGGDPNDVAAALALKGRDRVDALRSVSDDLPGYLQGLLGTAVRELDSLDREAGEKRTNAEQYLAQRQREDADRQRAEVEKDIRDMELGWQKAQDKAKADFIVFNKTGTDKEWDATVEAAIARAEQTYRSSINREQQAEIIMRAEAAKEIEARYVGEVEYSRGLEKKLAEVEAELKKVYGGASPSLRGSSPAPSGAVSEMDFATRTIHEMSGGAA